MSNLCIIVTIVVYLAAMLLVGFAYSKSNNDSTCEGIKYKKWNCFTVQFHPEANGGPKDTEFLFDRFLNNVKAAKEAR